jgi:tellurite methyltransferase
MTKPAISIERYSRFFSQSHAETVLDYGAGTLRNALYLVDRGFTVYAADVPEQVKALRHHPGVHRLAGLLEVGELKKSRLGVDVVLSTYVFNIIVQRAQRRCYLENAVANLRPGGYLLVEVSCRREEMECGSVCNHYFNLNDHGRSYTHDEFDRLLHPYGLHRICHYYSCHALAAMYQLTPEQNRLSKGGREGEGGVEV